MQAAVNNFAKILLQIEQSLEKRFIQMPLGSESTTTTNNTKASNTKKPSGGGLEPSSSSSNLSASASAAGANAAADGSGDASGESKETHRTTLQNWELSLARSTTLSQIFVHLQTLDESIAWSKSILNARCCMCKKKRDADKMLLCDKCDRGHHLYCLRPALSAVPDGEWFCPKCRPKDVEKTPRKIRESFGDIGSDGDTTSSSTASDTYSTRKRRGGGGGAMVNGKANHNNHREEEEDDEDEDEEEEEEEIEEIPVTKKGRATTTATTKATASKSSSSTTTTTATMNGHHNKAVNFHR